MRRLVKTSILVAAAAAALVLPASSPAATTIGSNLGRAPNTPGFNCDDNHYCTLSNSNLDPSSLESGGLNAPLDGVVVSFQVRMGATFTAPLSFRIIHPLGGGFTGAGTSPAVTPPLDQISPQYPTRLSIAVGDRIGVDCCQNGTHNIVYTSAGAGTIDFWTLPTALLDGEPARPITVSNNTDWELPLRATIEPDTDKDGFGDETQDRCPGSAGPDNGCPPPAAAVAPPTKCKKGFRLRKVKTKSGKTKKKCVRKKKGRR